MVTKAEQKQKHTAYVGQAKPGVHARVGHAWVISILLSLFTLTASSLLGSDFFEESEKVHEPSGVYYYVAFASMAVVALLLALPFVVAVANPSGHWEETSGIHQTDTRTRKFKVKGKRRV